MLFDLTETQKVLNRIVDQVNSDPAWHEDLMQEAIIHLWQLEEQRPGQSRSWYLQSCQFYLRHYIGLGRSIDSWKRHGRLIPTSLQDDEELELSLQDHSNGTATSEISAEEMLNLLCEHLTTLQQTVLRCLADGLSSREIGVKLRVSHKTVLKHRSRIAVIARELGIAPQNG